MTFSSLPCQPGWVCRFYISAFFIFALYLQPQHHLWCSNHISLHVEGGLASPKHRESNERETERKPKRLWSLFTTRFIIRLIHNTERDTNRFPETQNKQGYTKEMQRHRNIQLNKEDDDYIGAQTIHSNRGQHLFLYMTQPSDLIPRLWCPTSSGLANSCPHLLRTWSGALPLPLATHDSLQRCLRLALSAKYFTPPLLFLRSHNSQ